MFDQVPLLTDLLGALLVLATVIAITFEKQVAVIVVNIISIIINIPLLLQYSFCRSLSTVMFSKPVETQAFT